MARTFRQVLLGIAVAALLYGAQKVLEWWQGGQTDSFTLKIILLSGIYVTLAVSLNIVNGFTGQFSIGHAGFMAVGAYIGASVTYKFPGLQNGFGLFLSCLIGGGAAAFFGWLVGVPSLRLRGDYLAIVTLGFGEIIRVLLENTDRIPPIAFMSGAIGFSGIPKLTSLFAVFLLAAITIVASRNLKRSLHGLAFLAVREDEIAADSMGVNTTRVKVTAFVMGAFFAGAAGSLFAHNLQYIQPTTFNFILSINIVVMIVLGGLGSITGATLTAIFFTALPEVLRQAKSGPLAYFAKDEYRLVAFALLLALTMLLRPQGVFGRGELTLFRRRPEDDPPDTLPEITPPSVTTMDGDVLRCDDVIKRFGGLTAVDGFRVRLAPGELVGLIGPNGAGKTTAFNLLTGVYQPSAGAVYFDGQQISGEKPYPAGVRLALLTFDLLLAALGGFLVGTIIFSCVTALNVPPTELFRVFEMGTKSGLVWFCVAASALASLATARKRRLSQPGRRPCNCCALGIARTFQNIRLFPELTVLENVLVSAYGRRKTSLFSALLQTEGMLKEERTQRARARALLKEFGLDKQEKEEARNLPYGDQRRLEIARALMTQPKLLLLDEPAAGMNPQEKVELMSLIRKVRDEFGLTILLIEHDMKLVMGICERIYVLEYGRMIAEGTPEQIQRDPKVIAAYLGEEVEEEGQKPEAGGNS